MTVLASVAIDEYRASTPVCPPDPPVQLSASAYGDVAEFVNEDVDYEAGQDRSNHLLQSALGSLSDATDEGLAWTTKDATLADTYRHVTGDGEYTIEIDVQGGFQVQRSGTPMTAGAYPVVTGFCSISRSKIGTRLLPARDAEQRRSGAAGSDRLDLGNA